MKRSFWKVTLFLAVIISVTMTSCKKEEPNNGNSSALVGDLLKGEVTGELVLESGKTYRLEGGVHVKAGAVLKIEQGVTLVAQSGKEGSLCDYILVEQGGRMDAQGSSTKPIVMTSVDQRPGAWGGIHICGKAPVNFSDASGNPVQAKSEIGDANYGGSVANDNSGVYRYIRLEYTGYSFSADKEANGFTFYGVGNGTVCEYLQSYKGSDDGFEWFGGTVNAKYLLSTASEDDSFDWTYGWSGKGQFWVAQQSETVACDCLIEADNSDKFVTAAPRSNPMLSNLTLIGYNHGSQTKGIRLRAGTAAKIYNSLVVGTKTDALSVESVQTVDWFVSNSSFLQNIVATTNLKSASGTTTPIDFSSMNHVVGGQSVTLNGHVGTLDNGTDIKSIDPWFEDANYLGAVPNARPWSAGWSKSL